MPVTPAVPATSTTPAAPGPGAAAVPDLLYREQEEDLRAAVRALLADRCPASAVLDHIATDRTHDVDLWRTLAVDIGAAGLLVPEAYGGQGAGPREAAVVLEELGRAVAPVPYLTSAVIATQTLLTCVEAVTTTVRGGATDGRGTTPEPGDRVAPTAAPPAHDPAAAPADTLATPAVPAPAAPAAPVKPTAPTAPTAPAELTASEEAAPATEAATLLAALAAGERIAVLAVPLSRAPGAGQAPSVRAAADATLTGEVSSVADALAADVLLVPAHGPGGTELYAVETAGQAADRLRRDPITPLDLTRPLARIRFDGTPARRIAGPGTADAAIEAGLRTGAGLLASEQLGLAEWCLAETVRHTGERHQFGRPVGSFQALKHRMAGLWLDLVSARAAARAAADALATGAADAPIAVAVAQAHGARVAVHAAHTCVQLHGGIGMTWEHPAHLYLKRAKSDEIALGTPGRHQEALAALIDLPAPPAT
ncbi:acyl-CoA dehydrogenase family protein [Streptomyces sp. HSW2009]|uniref:acyl-CoA dehydrogenase family protein n=1 Tax=Streptomyces sp. HSW2009 TaxID=3142890 RepID=UPI0032EEE336